MKIYIFLHKITWNFYFKIEHNTQKECEERKKKLNSKKYDKRRKTWYSRYSNKVCRKDEGPAVGVSLKTNQRPSSNSFKSYAQTWNTVQRPEAFVS